MGSRTAEGVMGMGETPVKRALAWVGEQMREHPERPRSALVEAAAARFDLSPLDTEFLYRVLSNREASP